MKSLFDLSLLAIFALAFAVSAPGGAKASAAREGFQAYGAMLADSSDFAKGVKRAVQEQRKEWRDEQKGRQKEFKENMKNRREEMKGQHREREKNFREDAKKRPGEWRGEKRGDGRKNFNSPDRRPDGNVHRPDGNMHRPNRPDFKGHGPQHMNGGPRPDSPNFKGNKPPHMNGGPRPGNAFPHRP